MPCIVDLIEHVHLRIPCVRHPESQGIQSENQEHKKALAQRGLMLFLRLVPQLCDSLLHHSSRRQLP